MPICSGKTRRAPSRHCGDARVCGHTTTATHGMSTPSPIQSSKRCQTVCCFHDNTAAPTKKSVAISTIIQALANVDAFDTYKLTTYTSRQYRCIGGPILATPFTTTGRCQPVAAKPPCCTPGTTVRTPGPRGRAARKYGLATKK